jgi:hypothetical protein
MANPAFSPRSIWRQRLADNAPIVGAGSLAAAFNTQVTATTSTDPASPYPSPFNWSVNQQSYSAPVWVVTQNQPTQKVTLISAINPTLQAAWMNVPLPIGEAPLESSGQDSSMVVWRPSTDEMWEFYHFVDNNSSITPNGPSAVWGGYIPQVSQFPGVYYANSRTNNTSWGCRACGASILGGLLRLDEIAAGVIPHAIACILPVTGGTVAPAARSDSGTFLTSGDIDLNTIRIPQGSFFRFPAGSVAPGGLSAAATMIYNAIRDYGLFVVDTGPNAEIYVEDSRPPATVYTDSAVTVNPPNMPSNATMVTLPWSTIQQVTWSSPIPSGSKLCHVNGAVALAKAF